MDYFSAVLSKGSGGLRLLPLRLFSLTFSFMIFCMSPSSSESDSMVFLCFFYDNQRDTLEMINYYLFSVDNLCSSGSIGKG